MKFQGPIAMSCRRRGHALRHGLAWLVACGRDLVLAAWAIGVLAFCVLGLAGAMR